MDSILFALLISFTAAVVFCRHLAGRDRNLP